MLMYPGQWGVFLPKDKYQVLKHGCLFLQEETKQLSSDSTLLMHVCGKTGCPRTRGYKAILLRCGYDLTNCATGVTL